MAEATKQAAGGTCNICQATTIDLGDHVFTDESDGEKWDQLAPVAVAKGWTVRRGQRGGRELVCPGCARELAHRETMELPAFVRGALCPKCGSGAIKNKFCKSQEPDCTFVVDRQHMHRICIDCGFTMITAPADAARPWWKFW